MFLFLFLFLFLLMFLFSFFSCSFSCSCLFLFLFLFALVLVLFLILFVVELLPFFSVGSVTATTLEFYLTPELRHAEIGYSIGGVVFYVAGEHRGQLSLDTPTEFQER